MDEEDLETLLGELLDARVLVESETGEHVILAPEFERRRKERRAAVASVPPDKLAATLGEDPSLDTDVLNSELVGDALALSDVGIARSGGDRLQIAATLARFDHPHPTDGVPSGFVPLVRSEISPFVDTNRLALLYFWREECPPCDLTREALDQLVSTGALPDGVGLGAVYGPACPSYARDAFDVHVGPTLLVLVDGVVDVRLVGGYGPDAIEAEIEATTEYLG